MLKLEESYVSSSGSQFNVPGRIRSVVNDQLLFGFNRQLVELNNYGVLLYEKGDYNGTEALFLRANSLLSDCTVAIPTGVADRHPPATTDVVGIAVSTEIERSSAAVATSTTIAAVDIGTSTGSAVSEPPQQPTRAM
jgi:hypothetical protein